MHVSCVSRAILRGVQCSQFHHGTMPHYTFCQAASQANAILGSLCLDCANSGAAFRILYAHILPDSVAPSLHAGDFLSNCQTHNRAHSFEAASTAGPASALQGMMTEHAGILPTQRDSIGHWILASHPLMLPAAPHSGMQGAKTMYDALGGAHMLSM